MAVTGRDLATAKLVDPDGSLVQRLLRWRWVIVALSAGMFVVWEVIEHPSTASMLNDRHIFREALFFAILGPLLTGLALTLLARADTDRVEARQRLDLEHELSRELADAGSWEELTALIVDIPRRLLPVNGVSLFLRRAEQDQFDVIAEWWNPDGPSPRHPAQRLPCGCQACACPPYSLSSRLFQCHRLDTTRTGEGRNRHCLPLKHGDDVVGLLYHYLPEGVQPPDDQANTLNALAPAMGLALDAARPERTAALGVAAVSAERKRIARDLHDTLGQSLGYLHLKLDQLTGDETLQEIAAIRQELKRMSEVANESYEQVRDVVTGLRAPTATELAPTLEERARSMGERAGFEVVFLPEGTPHPLDPDAEQQVFYVVQEMLNNVTKHADAQRVELTLSWEPEALSIACSDDGRGFDPVACQRNGHFGLRMMRERAEEIGGHLNIASSPGRGTTIALSVPTATTTPGAARHGGHDEDPAR